MSYFDILLRQKRQVIYFALSGFLLALLASVFFPLKYSATSRLLIIPRSSLGVDPYTAVKSAERISENLAQIVSTASFFERVAKAGFNLDLKPFENVSEIKKRKLWKKTVLPQVLRGTALLALTVFHEDKEQAQQWAGAIAYVFSTQGFEYTGSDVQIKIVDTPVLSRFPVKPNFVMNGLLGLLVGAFLAAVWIIGRYR